MTIVEHARETHFWLPPVHTQTAADRRIRFLPEKVVCRASLTRFYFGGFRGQECLQTVTPVYNS